MRFQPGGWDMMSTIERAHTVEMAIGTLVVAAFSKVPAEACSRHAMRGVVGSVGMGELG